MVETAIREIEQPIEDEILDRVRLTLEDYLGFYERFTADTEPGWPNWRQAIRIRALMNHKRIAVGDDPGINGKTLTSVGAKIALEREYGIHVPTLVVGTFSGLTNAYAPDKVNFYAEKLHASPQEVLTVHEFSDLHLVRPDLDFIVINWDKLSISEDSGHWKLFEEVLDAFRPQYFIDDEAHNGKRSTSLRGRSVQRLVKYTLDKYLMALSATLAPNRYRDYRMLFHLLDPVKYPSPEMFNFSPPEVMQELLDRQVWFRVTIDEMREELGLGKFREEVVPVELSKEEAELYFRSWADCVTLGEGLTELRKILYNPRLSKYAAEDAPFPSSKMKAAKSLTDALVAKGEKVIIKSNLVKGVVGELSDLLGQGHNVLVVTGDTPEEERNAAYELFRNDPRYRVLLTSPVAEESIELITGNIPVSYIVMEPEMTPREFRQFKGRSYRRGQFADVTHYSLVAHSAYLEQLMLDFVNTLSERYGIQVPKKFIPRTIDLDKLAMRKAKEAVLDKIEKREYITKQEESLYDTDNLDRAVTHLAAQFAPSTFKSMKPFNLATLIQARWRNIGEPEFAQLVESPIWKKWTKLYEAGWQGSSSQETNRLLGEIVRSEYPLHTNPRVISVGDGAAYFSRATGIPTISVDIDRDFLEQGRRISETLGIKNSYVAAKATDIPLPDGHANVVVNAYTIFYLGQDKKRNQIEQSVLETNRLLEHNGLFLVALPYTIDDTAVDRFSQNLNAYGFTAYIRLSPKDAQSDLISNGFYLLGFRKTATVTQSQGLDLSFYENRVRFIQ